MSSYIGGQRQRGIALIMSLIFLLLLAIVATALVDTVVWQTRLGVAQQQARSQFQQLNGAVAFASVEVPSLGYITENSEDCEWKPVSDSELSDRLPNGGEVNVRRLRVAYECRETGNSESMCKPIEVEGKVADDSVTSGSRQVQGIEIITQKLTDQRVATFSNGSDGGCQ